MVFLEDSKQINSPLPNLEASKVCLLALTLNCTARRKGKHSSHAQSVLPCAHHLTFYLLSCLYHLKSQVYIVHLPAYVEKTIAVVLKRLQFPSCLDNYGCTP